MPLLQRDCTATLSAISTEELRGEPTSRAFGWLLSPLQAERVCAMSEKKFLQPLAGETLRHKGDLLRRAFSEQRPAAIAAFGT